VATSAALPPPTGLVREDEVQATPRPRARPRQSLSHPLSLCRLMRDATSPASCPPPPSATVHRLRSGRSTLCMRTAPALVAADERSSPERCVYSRSLPVRPTAAPFGFSGPSSSKEADYLENESQNLESATLRRDRSPPYSITSSARPRIDSGTVRPSWLAVFRLTTSSNVTGCITGRSAGFWPSRILPA
jgi:hypothetical protein